MRHRTRRDLPLSDPCEVIGLDPSEEENALCELEFNCITDMNSSKRDREEKELPVLTIYSEFRDPGYHIYQEDNIFICSEFLVGKCHLGSSCPKHHTFLPYIWQLRDRQTSVWSSVEEGAQQVIERLFSDPKFVQMKGVYMGKDALIDFSTMEVHNSQEIDRVRRLSTSTDPFVYFPTRYKFFYEEADDKWAEYEEDFLTIITNGLRNKEETVQCSNSLFTYVLYLNKMCQRNLQTGTIRRMVRRPIFMSPVKMSSELRKHSNNPTSGSKQGITTHPERGDLYPWFWIITDTKLVYENISLCCEDREFVHVYILFHKTMPESQYIILEISRIQNYFQWEKYKRKRDYMAQRLMVKNQLERHLFHGTDHSLVEAICQQNFDPRVSGKNGSLYGKGCYFARDASYSHRYSKANSDSEFFMFLGKVLVGSPTKGSPSLRRPPPINKDDPVSQLYDSCVSQINNPDIFVIFDNDQFYPYFLIKYRKMQELVILS